jgi:hypothetical protein
MNKEVATSCGTTIGVRAAGGVEAEVVDRNGQLQLRRLHTLFDVVEGGDLGEVIRMARHGESLVLCQPQCIVSTTVYRVAQRRTHTDSW